MADVFISYSSADKTAADAVCASLENNGISCWIAPRDIVAGSYAAAIIRAIQASKLMVLILSSHSNKSPQVEREIERAVSRNKVIYPLRIENVLPSEDLELFVSSEQWMDAFEPPLENYLEKFSNNVKQLLLDFAGAPAAIGPDDAKPVTNKELLVKSQAGAWSIAGAIMVVVSLVVLVNTIVRLQKGGMNSIAVAGVAIQTLLVLLAGSAFLPRSRKLLTRLFSQLRPNFILESSSRTWLALAVLAIIVTLRLLLPGLAGRYLNYKGDRAFKDTQFDEAIWNYQRAEALDAGSARLSLSKAHFNLGLQYDKARAYGEAAAQYQRTLDYDPANYAAANNLARVLILQEEPNRALALLNKLQENLASLPVEIQYFLFKNLGWANLKLHNYETARQQLTWALVKHRGAAAFYLLGKVYDEQGHKLAAREQWNSFVQLLQNSSAEEEVEPHWIADAHEQLTKGG
jgi:tetratricopeptide (TPR) repeat protein